MAFNYLTSKFKGKQNEMVNVLKNINTELYADGANLDEIKKLASNNLIKGFTTTSLMRKSELRIMKSFQKKQ